MEKDINSNRERKKERGEIYTLYTVYRKTERKRDG